MPGIPFRARPEACSLRLPAEYLDPLDTDDIDEDDVLDCLRFLNRAWMEYLEAGGDEGLASGAVQGAVSDLVSTLRASGFFATPDGSNRLATVCVLLNYLDSPAHAPPCPTTAFLREAAWLFGGSLAPDHWTVESMGFATPDDTLHGPVVSEAEGADDLYFVTPDYVSRVRHCVGEEFTDLMQYCAVHYAARALNECGSADAPARLPLSWREVDEALDLHGAPRGPCRSRWEELRDACW